MPTAPSTRMRTLATRWLTDRVILSEVTFVTDTRPLTKAVESGSGLMLTDDWGDPLRTDEGDILYADDPVETAALIRTDVVSLTDDVTVRRDVRELRVWIDDGGEAAAGQRLQITVCGDATLVGRQGQVISVERDSLAAMRRLTVRLANDE